jgi:hypothetical protein
MKFCGPTDRFISPQSRLFNIDIIITSAVDIHSPMSSQEKNYKLDKSVISIANLGDASDDRQFWLTKTPAERFEALELLRQVFYGYDPATARLQRILEVVDRA